MITIDGFYNEGTPMIVIIREDGTRKNFENPTSASLGRIDSWISKTGATVKPWLTDIGWTAMLWRDE